MTKKELIEQAKELKEQLSRINDEINSFDTEEENKKYANKWYRSSSMSNEQIVYIQSVTKDYIVDATKENDTGLYANCKMWNLFYQLVGNYAISHQVKYKIALEQFFDENFVFTEITEKEAKERINGFKDWIH